MNINGISRTSQNAPVEPNGTAGPTGETALMPPSDLNHMMNSGDLGSMIAAMLIENAAKSRETARASKQAAMAAEDAANQRKLEHMQEAATARLVGGLVGGGSTIVSGGLTMAGGFKGSNEIELSKWTGAAKASEGAGQIGKAVGDFAASNADRDVAAEEQRSKVAGRAITSADDQDKDAAELARKALDYYKEYVSASDGARSAAIHRA